MAQAAVLSNRDKTMLKAWGKAGDIIARALNNAIANDATLGRAALVAGGTNVATASATAVHAAVAGNAAQNLFPGPITNPAVPRNLTATFAASYDGGNITIVGTNQFDEPTTEVIVASAGNTVAGLKIFKTVTSITKGAVGANAATVSIGTGVKLGVVPIPVGGSPVLLFTNGVGEAVTWDATNNAFTATSAPNGARSYVLNFNQ